MVSRRRHLPLGNLFVLGSESRISFRVFWLGVSRVTFLSIGVEDRFGDQANGKDVGHVLVDGQQQETWKVTLLVL